MEQIIKYRAMDGKEFNDPKLCADYEELIKRVESIMNQLHPKIKESGCSFENGGGFIQQDIAIFKKVRKELLEEFKNKIDHHWIQQSITDENVDPSWVGRIVGDYDIKPYTSAWYRISCIDKLGREWGQIYFRNHSNEAEQKCLNPTSSISNDANNPPTHPSH